MLLIEKYRAASDTLREAAHAVLTPKARGNVTVIGTHRRSAT